MVLDDGRCRALDGASHVEANIGSTGEEPPYNPIPPMPLSNVIGVVMNITLNIEC